MCLSHRQRQHAVYVLCFCSHKKPGEHITEILADSVRSSCGGVKYCLSSTCTVHVLQCVFITVHSITYIHTYIALHTCNVHRISRLCQGMFLILAQLTYPTVLPMSVHVAAGEMASHSGTYILTLR